MVFFSDQKGIAKGETKSYKRWKIALCHTENELCIEVGSSVSAGGKMRRLFGRSVRKGGGGAGLLVRCFRNVRDRDTEI